MATKLTNAKIKTLEQFLALLLQSNESRRTDQLLSSFHSGSLNGMIVAATLYMDTTEQLYLYHRLMERNQPDIAKRFIPA